MSIRVTDSNGTLRQFWDDTVGLRAYTEWDDKGVQTLTRPYTPEENARADADASAVVVTTNKASIEQALSDALATLQTIIDTAPASITPQMTKDIARSLRRVIRLLIRRFDGTA